MQIQSQGNFDARLMYGEDAERRIARFLLWKGNGVLPVYEKVSAGWKGPRVFHHNGQLIAPDLMVFNNEKVCLVEAKLKTKWSWFRKRQQWETGIDLKCYNDYLALSMIYPHPFWILFLHVESKTSEGNGSCPTGLFGNEIKKLKGCVSHTSYMYGNSGMIYWAHNSLIKIAELSEIEQACKEVVL